MRKNKERKYNNLDPHCEKTYRLFLDHVSEGYSPYSFTQFLFKQNVGFRKMKEKFKNVELICKALDRRKLYKKTFEPIVIDPKEIVKTIVSY